jgi:hypothetical protein
MTILRRTEVVFLYPLRRVLLGSAMMRGFQLRDMLERHGSGRFHYSTKAIPPLPLNLLRMRWVRAQPRGAVYVFIKDAIDRLHPDALAELHERAAIVAHDPVDRPLKRTPRSHVDLHIAASFVQRDALHRWLPRHSEGMPKVGLVLHQADLRLQELPEAPADRFRPAYFGDPKNAFLPDQLMERISLVDVGRVSGMSSQLHRFADANFHYAVRPAKQVAHSNIFKPLTKAATAACCSAPVLVNRKAHDAEALLGTDYRYFVDDVDADSVAAMLDQAAADFGGPEWMRALDAMKELRERLGPPRITRDFETMLEEVL